jgi:methylated-DNA-[protein]-cysteine S-methyltransferase
MDRGREMTYFTYPSEIGELKIVEDEGYIVAVDLTGTESSEIQAMYIESAIVATAAEQLYEYLSGERLVFDLPLRPKGTEFQLAVWNALLAIPYGQTRSYRDIAVAIGNPKAVRAVGMANHHNPISFIIPCHRVIGANGSLVGYGGGLPLKKRLLDMEQSVVENGLFK